MILEFDKSAKTTEAMVRSLMESVQRALDSSGGSSDTSGVISEAIKQAKLAIYPIGSIYTSVDSTDPSNLFGGTWERFGKGKTLIGLDEDDTSFDTVNETGGSKTISYTPSGTVAGHTLTVAQMPSHSHTGNMTRTSGAGSDGTGTGCPPHNGTPSGGTAMVAIGDTGGNEAHSHGFTGTSATLDNLQPYITVYMWKRVA